MIPLGPNNQTSSRELQCSKEYSVRQKIGKSVFSGSKDMKIFSKMVSCYIFLTSLDISDSLVELIWNDPNSGTY